MRFAKVWNLIRSVRRRPQEILLEKERKRFPNRGRIGEELNPSHWKYILGKDYWNIFEKKRLELLRDHYPTPVTSAMFHERFGGKGTYTHYTFASINEKFKYPPDHPEKPEPFRVEGEGDGFQIFIVAPK